MHPSQGGNRGGGGRGRGRGDRGDRGRGRGGRGRGGNDHDQDDSQRMKNASKATEGQTLEGTDEPERKLALIFHFIHQYIKEKLDAGDYKDQ